MRHRLSPLHVLLLRTMLFKEVVAPPPIDFLTGTKNYNAFRRMCFPEDSEIQLFMMKDLHCSPLSDYPRCDQGQLRAVMGGVALLAFLVHGHLLPVGEILRDLYPWIFGCFYP